jgi:hypothetical protein
MKKLMILAFMMLAFTACNDRDDDDRDRSPTGPGTTPVVTSDRVEFRVFGSDLFSQVNIRYQDPKNGTTLVTSTVPYFFEVTNRDPSAFFFLEAKGFGNSTNSTLQVQIFVNGRLFKEGAAIGFTLQAQAAGTYHRP